MYQGPPGPGYKHFPWESIRLRRIPQQKWYQILGACTMALWALDTSILRGNPSAFGESLSRNGTQILGACTRALCALHTSFFHGNPSAFGESLSRNGTRFWVVALSMSQCPNVLKSCSEAHPAGDRPWLSLVTFWGLASRLKIWHLLSTMILRAAPGLVIYGWPDSGDRPWLSLATMSGAVPPFPLSK